MSFSFRPGRREGVPLLIGLAGASGSGKSYSALELAEGIASIEGGKVFVLDTENRRALHYADRFAFEHGELQPPFSPMRYGEALKSAEDAGACVVVIDSFSHEYEGEGGILDWASAEEKAGKKPPSQWIKPKSAHKSLVNQMLRAKPHIIVCLRAEEKMLIQKKPGGGTEVVAAADRPINERWHPICEKRFPYEITTSLLLLPGNPGVPIALKLQEQHKAAFPAGKPITAESGRFLASWAKGDTPAPSGRQSAEQWVEHYKSDVRDCATIDDLMSLQSRSAKALAKLQSDRPELHQAAAEAGTKRAAELQEGAHV
jgi:hypothetical protein